MNLPTQPGVAFRPITAWPGYAVGDDGSVWSAKVTGGQGRIGTSWRTLRLGRAKGRGDYPTVQLHCQGVVLRFYVHGLVATAFLGPRPAGLQTRHRNGNPEDNRLKNLRYGTPKQNGRDAVLHGRHYQENKGKLKEAQVREIKRRLAAGGKQQDIAGAYGVGQMTVSDIKTGRTWDHLCEATDD